MPSRSLSTALHSLAECHTAYGPGIASPQTAILFLVQDGERSALDQRWLEYSLFDNHGIPIHSLTLTDIVYLRAGYGRAGFPAHTSNAPEH